MNYAFIALLTVTIGIVGTIVTVFVYSITMPPEKELPSKNKIDESVNSICKKYNYPVELIKREDINQVIEYTDKVSLILKKRDKIDRMRAKIIPGIKTGKVIAGSKTFNWDTVEKKEVSKPFKFSRRYYSNTFNAGVYAMLLR